MAFTDEVEKKLRLCVAELLAKSQGNWIGVNEYSFADIADKIGIERRYMGYVTSALKEMKMLEVTGIKRWTRYRTMVSWIDVDKVVEHCELLNELYLEEERNKKKGKNDNKPLFVKDTNMKGESSKPIPVPTNKFHAMESKVFTIRNNKIFEGMIVGIVPSSNGYKHQLSFDSKTPIAPEQEIEYFSYYELFPNVKALIVNLEKNITHYNSKK